MPVAGRPDARVAGIRGYTVKLRASVAAALVLAGLALGAAPAPGAAAAQDGVNIAVDPSSYASVPRVGARWARMFLYWRSVAPTPHGIDERSFARYSEAATRLSQSHVKVILVVLGAPAWASATRVAGGPPARPVVYAEFLHLIAQRLAGRVAAYEIWNEPDGEQFWGTRPDAGAYARLLIASYPAVRSADPHAKVVFGGTANNYVFLDAAYRHGAGGHFDAVAVHTDLGCERHPPEQYLRDPGGQLSRWSFLGYRSVRHTMLAHGDRRPIWMTELGWSATGVVCSVGYFAGQKPWGVSEAQQADFLLRAYGCLAQDTYVPVALWFQLRDADPNEAHGIRYGLLRLDGSPRPAWYAFLRLTDPAATPPGRCVAHYLGPHVRLSVHHDAGAHVLIVRMVVTSDLGVARMAIRLDGRAVRRAAGPGTSLTARIPDRLLAGRRHRITAAAVDVSRNGGRADLRAGGR